MECRIEKLLNFTGMQFFSADFVFSAHSGFIANGILAVNDDGSIADLIDPAKTETVPDAEKFSGLLCPGFINAHCHLELSHLRSQISKHTGFVGFAKELLPKRNTFSAEQIAEAITLAEDEMYRNGIVAVGDIANTADSFAQKAKGRLKYHTFIELLTLNPVFAETVFEKGKELLAQSPQPASLVPHAPYSVSHELMRLIADDAAKRKTVSSIHSEESPAEEEFSLTASGPMLDFYKFLGIDISYYKAPGMNSLRASLPNLLNGERLLLVHNTLTTAADIVWANLLHPKLSWCFCPNANLYIENRLPDFNLFRKAGAHIVVGTDSLASNDQLSILDELKVIAANAPEIPLEDLLTWATKNGAEALQFDELGTFEKNKKPGIVLITGFEEINGNLNMRSSAKITRMG